MTEISEIIRELSKPLPADAIKTLKRGGTTISYIPHYTVKERLNEVCPDWSGEVRAIHQVNGKVAVVYRLTIAGVSREAIGYEDDVENLYGDPFSNAEAMAFKRAAAWFGLGLYLYDKPANRPAARPQPARKQQPTNGKPKGEPKTVQQWVAAYEELARKAAEYGIDAPAIPDGADIAAVRVLGHELKQQYLARKRAVETHDPPS